MTNPSLTIKIPQSNIVSIDDLINDIKKQLVYFETPLCREFMPEEHRRLRIKQTTERFREALRVKESLRLQMANKASDGFDVLVFDHLYS
jgi:hypothetical protein